MLKIGKAFIKRILPAVSIFLIATLLLSTGCGGESSGTEAADPPKQETGKEDNGNQAAQNTGGDSQSQGGSYSAPEFKDASFHAELAEGNGYYFVDLSGVNEGYVAASGVADVRLKFQVIKDDVTYNYDLASDGTPSVFPLQSGSGYYAFRIMENVVDSKYAAGYETGAEAAIADEFQPYLRPSDYAKYTQESACVVKAKELASGASSASDVIAAVYEFVCSTVTYDTAKAATVQSGYLPNPDETMATGKGICFDYASLAAAMLRSQGIPTKIIFGYVAPDDLYHAWNMFYTAEDGWVTVEFKIDPNQWNRLDLTFSANGSDSEFIGDGTNYSDLYQY